MRFFSQKKIKISRILQIAAVVVLGAILGTNIYLANARRLGRNRMPTPMGIGMATVLSDSMEPKMSKGDLIIVKEVKSVKVDDIVVYDTGYELIVHRIIEIDGEKIVTQGDANPSPDDAITKKDIKGKVVCTIPFVGTVVYWIKTPIGTIVILAMALILLEVPRIREKKKDTEEIDKIKEEIRKLRDEM